jgi:hypothetical protein
MQEDAFSVYAHMSQSERKYQKVLLVNSVSPNDPFNVET